eukprot:TRINITY_DN1852_c1_g1_i13.p2 TRINITY_DN1852_c1_g1~~TRINITY_DN1852_c1_g1_i13.p2  ORF type:complete len:273 (+),score=-4.50 TRINITY_DN1852_c1_g1_i13:1565-2383(+)
MHQLVQNNYDNNVYIEGVCFKETPLEPCINFFNVGLLNYKIGKLVLQFAFWEIKKQIKLESLIQLGMYVARIYCLKSQNQNCNFYGANKIYIFAEIIIIMQFQVDRIKSSLTSSWRNSSIKYSIYIFKKQMTFKIIKGHLNGFEREKFFCLIFFLSLIIQDFLLFVLIVGILTLGQCSPHLFVFFVGYFQKGRNFLWIKRFKRNFFFKENFRPEDICFLVFFFPQYLQNYIYILRLLLCKQIQINAEKSQVSGGVRILNLIIFSCFWCIEQI